METALVLPWFLFAMLSMLQFARIQTSTCALLAGAQDTAREMAAYAYIKDLGASADGGIPEELLKGGLSLAYAKGQILKRSGVTSDEGTFHILQSSFRDETIDLVGRFTPTHTLTLLPVKKQKSIVRARVRAWTGREGHSPDTAESEGDGEEGEGYAYVAETGTVYHADPDCTHIKLTVQSIPMSMLSGVRNLSGGIYHACEKCGKGTGGTVYISPYGDKYHSSGDCSGLKRTVNRVPVSELGSLRPCSKCGGGHSDGDHT